ncbi:MAG: methyltransferase [Gemmatimonadetes bacterium]|nr:methyltransferase [Gemmatimonadota bacterium]
MDSSQNTDDPARDAEEAAPSQSRQAFGVQLPRRGDPALRSLRGQNVPHYQGHRPWNASWLLISYLEQIHLEGLRIVDVGCGWGLASIYCAHQGAQVTATDIDPQVFPYVSMLSTLNGVEMDHVTASFDELPTELVAAADLLIGADICFRVGMVADLYDLIQSGRAAGLGSVAISDPGRIPYRDLSARCVADLGAQEGPWQTVEPLLDWPGERPTVTGRLLRLGGT